MQPRSFLFMNKAKFAVPLRALARAFRNVGLGGVALRSAMIGGMAALALLVPRDAEAGTIVSKVDTDRIFALSQSAWEAQAETMQHPGGWVVRVVRSAESIAVVAMDPSTGVELSTEPIYSPEDLSTPQMVIVSRRYGAGTVPRDDSFESNLQAAAATDLGAEYDVGVKVDRGAEKDRVEIFIAKASPSDAPTEESPTKENSQKGNPEKPASTQDAATPADAD